jgi:pilus assembly protein TadC
MDSHSLFESVGRLFSRKQVKDVGKYLSSAGMEMSPEAFAGFFFLIVAVVSLMFFVSMLLFPAIKDPVFGFFKSLYPGFYDPVIVLLMLLASLMVSYFAMFSLFSSVLVLKAETRRNAIETALPDFLMLVSANVKAGMTLDQAMWYAAKPEFGLLSVEVKAIIKKAFSGESLSSALDELAERFDSKIFQRTVALIKQASATGGEIAEVLERTSQDARASAIVRKEISASLILYEIFVLFAAVIGTPFLLAVSTKLITVLEKAFAYLPEGRTSVSQFSLVAPSNPIVTSSQFFWFTLAILVVTSVFSSFIVGTIRSGSKSEGLKYLPFVLVGSYLVFQVVTILLDQFFVSLA